MNVVSFSLFGTAPLFCVGAVKNAESYPRMLPGWRVVIYIDSDVPRDTRLKLEKAGAELRTPPSEIASGMFWRYLVLDDPKVERAIFRDCDSRPTHREMAALKAWQESSKPFHSIRDQPHHHLPLGGGLWGVDFTKFKAPVPHLLRHMQEAITKSRLAKKPYTRSTGYGLDQAFLTRSVWPLAQQYGVLEHDSCNRHVYRNAVSFPCKTSFDDLRFVGEVIDEQERPHVRHWQERLNWLTA